jgi:PAS domain S-box-containing protein
MEAVLGQIGQGVNIVDAEGRVVLVNPGFMEMYGFPAELGAPGTPLADFVRHRLTHGWRRPDEPPDGGDIEALVAHRVRQITSSGSSEFDEQLPGRRTIRVRRQRLPDGMLVSTYSDVTEERRREQHAALLATAVEQSGDSVEVADSDYRLIYVNPAFTRLTGWTREEAVGRVSAEILRSDQHTREFYRELQGTVERGEVWKGRLISRHRDGALIHQGATISPVREQDGRLSHFVAVKRDIGEQVRAAEALRASEERYRGIVEDQTEFILRFDADFTVTFLNRAYERHLGRPREQLIGSSILNVMTPEQQAVFLDQLEGLVPEQPTVSYEMLLPRPDGRLGWEQWTDRAIFDADRRVMEYQSVGRDINERREAEEALRASEARFRAIVEDQSEFISRFTSDFEITFLNRAYARQLGRPREAIIGTSVLNLMTPEQQAAFRRQLAALTPDAPTVSYEMEAQLPDGSTGWEQWTDRALFDAQGRVIEYQSVGRDITEQRRAAAELRESEERFRAIAEGVPLPITIARLREPEILFVNERAREAFHLQEGYAGDEVIQVWACAEDRVRLARQLLQHGRVEGFEAQLLRADGSSSWVLISARVMTYRGREAMLAAITDITERRYMEHVVRESQARLAAFMTHAPVAMYLKNVHGRYVLANPEMSKVFARPAEQMIGLTAADTGVQHDLAHVAERDREILATGHPSVCEEHLPDLDAYRWAMVIRFPVLDPSGAITHVGGFHVDITRTKQVEDLLKHSEQRFRTIAEAHPVPMVIAGVPDLEPLFANIAFEELFRLTPGDLRRTDAGSLYADRTDRKRVRQLIRRRGRLDGYELVLRRGDGSLFPASLASRLIDYDGQAAVVTSITDLTEKRRAEAEIARQREALHQSEKMSALGGLLAGVAHELNNPLSIVVGQAVLLEDLSSDPATKTRAAKIHAAAERCARIVRTFLAMARSRPSERGPIDVNGVIEAALELLAYGLRSAGITVACHLGRAVPPVWGDGDQLHQVMSNLIVNAQHALQSVDPPRELRVSTRRAGDVVEVQVVDNGPGVDPALAKRIFEPFFTTKPAGHGTGIGLSVCHGIVSAHGGTIELDGRSGRGAAFVVRLPASEEALAGEAPRETSLPKASGGRVLLVDDEPEIGTVYAEVLRRAGHEVTVAISGNQALSLLRAHSFDLVVSDLRMPDLDGPGLHRTLSESSSGPSVRFIFMTGDALSPQVSRFLKGTGCEVLEKPVEPDDLVARVRAHLADRS